MSRHLHDDASLYYITFFVESYNNITSSLLLKDTGHSSHKQYNYTLSQIKTSSNKSQGQKEAACVRVIRPKRPLQ